MQREESPELLKITECADSGVRSMQLSRMAIGMVVRGEKIIYHNDHSTTIRQGEVYLLQPGIHYIEHRCREGIFEQINFYLSSQLLQQIIVNLTTNYSVSTTSTHKCDHCRHHNFIVTAPTDMLAEFFHSVSRNFRLQSFRDPRISQQMKLSELVLIILSGEDNCLKNRLVSGADRYQTEFIQTVYNNIFTDVSIEQLAEQTNRSLTSFKKEFWSQFHTPPHRWLVEQRLHLAKILLTTTQKTISEIGTECAFTNISHFIKLFKHHYHTTPAALRKELKTEKSVF